MTKLNSPRPHATAGRQGARRASARRPSDQLVYDAVVAAYIHDISDRRGRFAGTRRR